MPKELVFGHKSPDTDAIVAAKAFSYLQNQLGYDTEAVALGVPNAETNFVLNHFDEPMPRVISKVAGSVDAVMLVDHNEAQQSVADLADVTVTHVVDHHRVANFETAGPLTYLAKPVGCTSTILTQLFDYYKIEMPTQLAGLMLSAIISDTLLLKSPTTTDEDREALRALAEIADIDVQSYGIEMLKAGTDLASKTDSELVNGDAKTFELGGKKVRIDQINTVDLDDVFSRQAGLEKAMQAEMAAEGYDLFLVLATNVLDSNSELLVAGEPTDVVEKAFGTTLKNNRASLPGVVSRKKQVVPPLTKALEG